jgi:uncharacterized membrane protein YfcA
VLPIAAFFVLNRHLFPDRENAPAVADRRTIVVCVVAALIIGVYDGFYGPGTGTFLIIAFTVFAKMSVGAANAQARPAGDPGLDGSDLLQLLMKAAK